MSVCVHIKILTEKSTGKLWYGKKCKIEVICIGIKVVKDGETL